MMRKSSIYNTNTSIMEFNEENYDALSEVVIVSGDSSSTDQYQNQKSQNAGNGISQTADRNKFSLLKKNDDGVKSENVAEKLVNRCRNAFNGGITKSLKFRRTQLEQLLKMFLEHEEQFIDALAIDLHKSKNESDLTEFFLTVRELRNTISHLTKWTKPEKVKTSMAHFFDNAFIHSEPYGVVLIIGSWNFPIQLNAVPLVGAIAAGNCAVIKPSEFSSSVSNLFAKLVPKYLNQDCYTVYLGGVSETTELLCYKFDYIFYTGSTQVGKIVREASNKFLTPVTLELGGKSPVFIDESVNMDTTVKRIISGKLLNVGQTCIAPDYILCTAKVQAKFVQIAAKVMLEFYGADGQKSPDLGRIVNDKHFQRLNHLLKCGTIAVGGETNSFQRYIGPSILTNVQLEDEIMNEEIFGPILPIVVVAGAEEAIEIINNRPKPLSLYVFSSDKKIQDLFLNGTSSGSLCINDVLTQYLVETLPFGGVGDSGMGAYHGKFTFDTFSHKKSVLKKNFNCFLELLQSIRYPPLTESKVALMKSAFNQRNMFDSKLVTHSSIFLSGIVTCLMTQYILRLKESSESM